MLAGLLKRSLDPVHLLAVLVDVKQRNPPNLHGQQGGDVGVRQIAVHLPTKWLEAIVHGLDTASVGPALLDFL